MPKRSALRITKRTVDALTVDAKDTLFWDRDLAGFGVRVHATGRLHARKRTDTPLVDWLDNTQMQALLDAPDPTIAAGIRDRAMLYLCFAAGLRVSS